MLTKRLNGLEQLERRELLTCVSFDPGTGVVEIEGDDRDNRVIIYQPTLDIVIVQHRSNHGSWDYDAFTGSFTSILFKGHSGNDFFENTTSMQADARGHGGDDTLIGGSRKDTLHGGAGSDLLYGKGGPDMLYGGGDDDEMHGGSGRDEMYGEDGADTMHGGDDQDTMSGGQGDDILKGDKGNDYLYGDGQNDTIHGGKGNDHCYGGGHNDALFGETGQDTLEGNGGDDRLNGEFDGVCDSLTGGDGRDEFIMGYEEGGRYEFPEDCASDWSADEGDSWTSVWY